MHNAHLERRKKAGDIWWAGVRAVQPQNCVPSALADLWPTLPASTSWLLLGGGKAGGAMAQAAESFLLRQGVPGESIKGWINVPEGASHTMRHVHLHPARAPGVNFPTPAAVQGTLRMFQMLDQAPAGSIILCLISGGGSALLAAPVDQVPLEDKISVSKTLSDAGASIAQLNTVRKHLSQVKGGGLALRCFGDGTIPRRMIALIISDVIDDPLDVIASGPTAPDPTTFADALAVLSELQIVPLTPPSVLHYLREGQQGKRPETMKSPIRTEPALVHRMVANNRLALEAAGQHARQLGYEVIDLGDRLQGDTLDLARSFVSRFGQWRTGRPVCILSGGETTVRLPDHPGRGGRNQSMALAILLGLGEPGLENATILCGGTDGEDGPTDAAGGFADSLVWDETLRLNLDPAASLARQDAYPFLKATGGLFVTGLTETNVMDLRIFLLD